MENVMLEIIKTSPLLGFFLVFWYFQRQDYRDLINSTQEENYKREEKYQDTIDKNQSIISSLADNLNVVEDVKKDVEEIKNAINMRR